LTSATDDGGTITYTYFPDGKAKTITTPGGAVTSMQYADAARNQTQLVDPSAGTITYTYDSFGRVKTQIDARNQSTTYTYLSDGRTDYVVSPEGTTTYVYNTNKQLVSISSPGSVSRTYSYDTRGRVISVGENIAGANFSTTFTYDTYGRLSTRTHPSGITETMGYNNYGYLATISAGGSIRYTMNSMNARGQITGATYGSNLTGTYGFDDYGYPTTAVTGSIQDYLYSFNPYNGNLSMRRNMINGIMETFTYDNLDRLTEVNGPQNLTMTYSDNGNISTKSDIGTTAFGYGVNAGPYALTGATSSTGVIPSTNQAATYTSFEKVNSLTEGGYSAAFVYNADRQRAKMDVTQNGTNILSRYYAGSSYIKDIVAGVSKEWTYIGGDAYTAPVIAVTLVSGTIYYYLLRDHLGTVTHVVRSTDNYIYEHSYDACSVKLGFCERSETKTVVELIPISEAVREGRRRNPTDWSYDLTGQPGVFADRGFTGHEYLPWFNLINMNGRLYDPLVGRFLNVDPYVQMPDNSQNLNRYSYCLNNPLRFTDPNGEFFWFPVIFGAVMGAWINGSNAAVNGGNVWKAAAIGAAAGGIGAWAGGAVVSGIGIGGFFGGAAAGASGGFAGGFVSGAGNAWSNGANFGDGFNAGLSSGGIGALAGGAIGGLVGGFSSVANDGNFWDGGFRTGPQTASLEGGDKIYGPYSLKQVDIHGSAKLGMDAVKDASGVFGLLNVSELAYNEAKTNFVGSTAYTGRCSNYVYNVYKNIGHPLGTFNTAVNTGNYSTLQLTTSPARGDIVQYLQAEGSPYNHVAIYAGDNSMFSSSSSAGMIKLQKFLSFNPNITPHFYHYVGKY
jgi:RHS repeat-associated protein